MANILLVDGDPLQAHNRISLLERQFGQVHRVGTAAEALLLVDQPQYARDLALVITSHAISGLSVPDFVAELQERLPHLRVLVLGNGHDESASYCGRMVRYLPSAFASEQLCATAENLLDIGAQPA